jgi:hypothetical protein
MVPLDLFPAGLLQTITTAKTFTPDLQGDFSGAQVDIRTREYPARRQLSVSTSQNWNSAATGRIAAHGAARRRRVARGGDGSAPDPGGRAAARRDPSRASSRMPW